MANQTTIEKQLGKSRRGKRLKKMKRKRRRMKMTTAQAGPTDPLIAKQI